MNINVQLYTSFVADESVITKEHYSALCTLQAGCAWRPRAPAPYAAGWQCLEAPPRMLQAGCAWRPRPVCCRLAVPGGPAPYAAGWLCLEAPPRMLSGEATVNTTTDKAYIY